MRIRLTLAVGSRQRDVLVDAPRGTTLGDLSDFVGSARWFVDDRPVPADHPLGSPPLVHGVVLRADHAGPPREPRAPRVLSVVGGEGAGRSIPLGVGEVLIGRAADATLSLRDPEVSRRHARIIVDDDGIRVRDLGSTNGSQVDGVPIGTDSVPLASSSMLQCGQTQMSWRIPDSAPLTVRPDNSGGLSVARPPRLLQAQPVRTVEFPAPPDEPSHRRFPWTMVIAPLVLGAMLWLVTHFNSVFLLVMLLSPVLLAGNALSDKFSGRREYRRSMTAYAAAMRRAELHVTDALHDEVLTRRVAAPDPARLLGLVIPPSSGLWERRHTDSDALLVRLGVADMPAELHVTGDSDLRPVARSVPISVSLRALGVLGVAGPPDSRQRLASWLIAQLAALHPPRDLTLMMLCDSGDDRWAWFGWLPHAMCFDSNQPAELDRLIAQRTSANVVVIIDDADRLRRMPELTRILASGPASGVMAICLAAEPLELPEECAAVVRLDPAGGPGLRLTTTATQDAVGDLVDHDWIDRFAHALAPVRDAAPDTVDSHIPDTVRFVDIVGGQAEDPHLLAKSWAACPRSTVALLGLGATGPTTVDIARDGPHALVAGTTGSGKSELLQTLIAGLALANRPDELSFLLIDYKGGAAFAECADLPHTVGLVTDLDPRLTRRALASLAAELRRREHVLADCGIPDLAAYVRRREEDPALPVLPRLVIVIDEFASLAADLPDFVTGLVDIARRGRSLGVHLVLATQRPAGAVSAEVRANTALRICLRVTDPAESIDVISSPEAATISPTAPGRAHLRISGGGLTIFQTAHLRARPPDEPTISVTPAPWHGASEVPLTSPRSGPTDLSTVVTTLRMAADLVEARSAPCPWLPPLASHIRLDAIVSSAPDELSLGLWDLPDQQRQIPYCLDLAAGTHIMIAGGPRSGRTSALRTIAGSIARHRTPAHTHLYVLDCAGSGLSTVEQLPCCGAVVPGADIVRGGRLVARLADLVARRSGGLAADGYTTVAEQRAAVAPTDRLPWIVLLVDSWEGFLSYYQDVEHGRLVDGFLGLLREGPAAGLTVAITGDRTLLTSRAAPMLTRRLILRMADQDGYGIAGIALRDVPADPPPGRALVPPTDGRGSPTEVQLAAASSDLELMPTSGVPGTQALVRDLVPEHQQPMRLRPLPSRISLADILRDKRSDPAIPLGLGGDDARPVGLILSPENPGALIAGPPGSGRSTAVLTAIESARHQGLRVVVVATARSGFRHHVAPDDADCLRRTLSESPSPTLVVVEDAAGIQDPDMDLLLESIARGEKRATTLLAAGLTDELHALYRGFTTALRRHRCGLLLCPSGPVDGELLGVRLSRGLPTSPGRGVLVHRGKSEAIQVALPSTEHREAVA